ncbi:MAG: PQQ-binding-like beta-propeller repeat protein [Candidatus Thermoplasmatota archaeon]|nr:PQQ-binding-like beta-propeller repeat protein [Candidatus Thermoplasmatota archaeon]
MMYRTSILFSFLLLISSVISGALVVDADPGMDQNDQGSYTPETRAAPADSWPVYKGDLQNTGFSSTVIPMEKSTRPLWIERIPYLKQSNSPTIYGDMVFTGSGDGTVRGVDIDTGAVVWSIKATYKHINTAVTVNDGNVYFAAADGRVYGYDIETKTKELDVYLNASGINGAPVVADGMLFIGTMGKNLQNAGVFGIDLATETISWQFHMGTEVNTYGFKGTPAYLDGRIYIGSGDGFMYCFDKNGFDDGNDGYDMEDNTSLGYADIIWQYNATSSIVGSPMIAEGMVVFGNDIGRLFCLDADDGTHLWDKKIGAGEIPSIQTSPSYNDGIIYVGAQRVYGPYNNIKGSSLWAMRLSNSEVQWRFNSTGQMLASSPALTEDAVVFGAGAGNTSVYCISTENENIADEDRILWRVNVGAPVFSAPAIANGRIFIGRTDGGGDFGKLYAFGSPDPTVSSVWLSDQLPFIGEQVSVNAMITNNATIGADISVRFMLTNFNNSNQKELGVIEGARVEAFSNTVVSADWVVEQGFDMVVAFIIEVQPEDKDSTNNFGTLELSAKGILKGYWTSSGGGPGRTGIGRKELESNRTYWQKDLGNEFTGPAEDIWYHGFNGNGTISAVGGILYMTTPEGDLLALNATPGHGGVPGEMWRYSNSSVNFVGRPVLLVDQDQTFGGSNKVFAYGDDGYIWAFDWVGYWDGRNDGPYTSETSTGYQDGDVIWRRSVSGMPTQPFFISGANVVMISGSMISAYDDDTGDLIWTRTMVNDIDAVAGDNGNIFLIDGTMVRGLDPITGDDVLMYDIKDILGTSRVPFISYAEEVISLVFNDTALMLDAFPDDNEDGTVDLNDSDEGVYDNGSLYDLLWMTSFGEKITSPPSFSDSSNMFCVASTSGLRFLNIDNGTMMGFYSLSPVSGRMLSAEDSFYVMTGDDPWMIRAFSLSEAGSFVPTWTQTFASPPRGEPALIGGRIFLAVASGMVYSIGAANNEPVAVIVAPDEGMLVLPGEMVTFDASSSHDIEGDPLTYSWYLEGSAIPLYEGTDPVVTMPITGVGRTRLILKVYDDMMASSQDSINITLLKRITSPDYRDNYNNIHIHMSFGISESSGAYFINSTIPDDSPEAEGAVFTSYLEFTPLPKYAEYRFEWANVSIGYQGKEFTIGMNQEKLRLFMFDADIGEWVKAPLSGIDLENGKVWGNFTGLLPTYYAIGILDNHLPEFRHRVSSTYVYRTDEGFTFMVEYRDSDGNIPRYIKIVVDNDTELMMGLYGVQGNMSKYTFYSVEGLFLSPGWHSYYFEADDGFFITKSGYYAKIVQNSPPIVNVIGPHNIIKVREKVQFSGDGSSDPDGDTLSYYWDFDASNGIDREKAGPVVDNIFYSPGVYKVTLTVSDGTTSVSKNVTVTVVEDDKDLDLPAWEKYFPLILAGIAAFLFIAIIIFLMISKKGHEEQSKITRDIEGGWVCPECGNSVGAGLDECYDCGYEYDPLDFEDEHDEM